MTEQEITQARADLAQLDIEQLRCGVMLQLLKIEALTKERDQLQKDLNADLSGNAKLREIIGAKGGETMFEFANRFVVERDALLAAAMLALNRLVSIQEWVDRWTSPGHPVSTYAAPAIAALKKAGVCDEA